MKKSFTNSVRYSTGPLYSAGELATTERYLADMGLTDKKDEPNLGIRLYFKPGDAVARATIYLDELGAHPNQSGIMMLSKPDGGVQVSSVWDFAKQGIKERTDISLTKTIRKFLGMKP